MRFICLSFVAMIAMGLPVCVTAQQPLGLEAGVTPFDQLAVHSPATVAITLDSPGDVQALGSENLDSVSIVDPTPIPEPATYMLFGLGLLACAQRFRRARPVKK